MSPFNLYIFRIGQKGAGMQVVFLMGGVGVGFYGGVWGGKAFLLSYAENKIYFTETTFRYYTPIKSNIT